MEKPGDQFPSMGEEREQLELRLGPPGHRQWIPMDTNDEKRCNKESQRDQKQQPIRATCLQSSQVEEFKYPEKGSPTCADIGTNVYNKRAAPAPVVGWPPLRSFRKKITATSTSKPAFSTPQNGVPPREGGGQEEQGRSKKDLFVKINMEGVPIGRKINLNAYDSYQKLSVAIKDLFTGLVSASREKSVPGNESELMVVEQKGDEGDRTYNEEYTLVYEDNEGDRILVGDVPWQMFVTTAKRLRVLKSTEPSLLPRDKEIKPHHQIQMMQL